MTPNPSQPWVHSPGEAVRAQAADMHGLSDGEAARRLAEHGPNELESREREPWHKILLRQFANPLVYLLLGAAAIKAAFKGPADASVIGAVLLIMALIGFVQEMRARRAMAALLRLSAPRTRVRREGREFEVDATAVVPGDLLVLEAGDSVAADARLLEEQNLKMNESAFTGESLPAEKDLAPVPAEAPLHERRNMIYMGTTVNQGRALALVTGTGMDTEMGRILHAVSDAEKEKTPLQRGIDNLGRLLIKVVLGAVALLALAGLAQDMPWVEVLMLAVAAAVSGVPEGLPAAVTVVLSIAVSRMARRHVLIRRLNAVETLGAASVICTDKTGTLTLNQMTVAALWIGGRNLEVTGAGYAPEGEFREGERRLDPRADHDLADLLKAGALCSDASLVDEKGNWTIRGDPTEGCLVTAAAKAGFDKAALEQEAPRVAELPFESENRFMATLHEGPSGRTLFVKGSVEKLLELCGQLRSGGAAKPLGDPEKRDILEINRLMAEGALRVLALASTPYPAELGEPDPGRFRGRLVLLGLAGMADPPREEARRSIETCRTAGIRVAMITGDNPVTASAIAARLGIGNPGEAAVTGREIEEMDDPALEEACRSRSVFARIEPLHKLRIVEGFKRSGHVAAMTGDGVNDAPALESAGIGVAMGVTGTDAAKEAADMVLADDNFASIVAAVEEGRILFNRLRNVTFFLLMTCAGELLTLLLSVALFGESPLEPIQILWINLVTGTLVAIPLGMDPGTGDELGQPPRHPSVGLVYPGMLFRIFAAGLCMSIPVVWIFRQAPLGAAGETIESLKALRQTVVFTSIGLFEWFFAFQARSTERNLFHPGFSRNRWLFGGLALGLTLQALVVYLPAANALFKTRPLHGTALAWCLLPGLLAVALEAARKKGAPRLFSAGQWTPVQKPRVLLT